MAKYKIIPSSRNIVQSSISIGHKAEKGVEAIEFDLTAWVETYGSGTLTVIMRRWGDAAPYPIALEIDENNKATWTLSDTDTAKAGMAYAQLSYIVGETVVKKSDIYTFRVMDSLTGEGDPPEAYESWLEHLTHLAAEAMAEVLDIEGIVTDKTLTVDGGIADAKATGEALAEKVDVADYSELSARVRANTIALAEKADRSTTYTKTEVDQMIEDVEVETDTTLEIDGAPADAAETGRQIGLLKADLGATVSFAPQTLTEAQKAQARANLGILEPGQEVFESTFAFRLLSGNIKSTGAIDETAYTRMITRGAIYLRKGDVIVTDDISMLVFAVARYSSPDASASSFMGNVKSLYDDNDTFAIPEDGWYIPIVEYTDKRNITTVLRRTASLHVYGIRQNLLSKVNGELDEKYCFWYSGVGDDGEYSTGITCYGLNRFQNRVNTLPFPLKKGVTLSIPEGMRYAIRKYSSLDMRMGTYKGSLTEGPGEYTPSVDEYISLNIGKSDDSNYTDLDEAKTAASSITFSKASEDDDYESPIYDAIKYGCKADGTTNDAPIIQAILNTIGTNGGGKIYFPAGTYKVDSTLILYSNTTVELDEGATLLRGASIKFVFLTNCTNSTLAYNGEKNIVVNGGKIDIGTGITQGACAFGFVHAQNIRVENVETVHNNAGYHMYDICGCKNVKIKDCYLHDPITTQASAELIQFDGAGSYTQFPSPQLTDGAATFDDTPCVDIEVSGCTFELNSYSPAFGNHNGEANKNINVHDCVITGTGGTRGAVAFATGTETTTINATTQVLIHHNIFEGCSIGFTFSNVSTGKIYVRDNIFKGITTLKANPDSPVGEFLNNIELA